MDATNRHRKEHTSKSGSPWTRDEIGRVLALYLTPQGKLIHEGNPEIQRLARELDRPTRSVEAQLQMFRALERGMAYSRNKMSAFCVELWEEHALKHAIANTTPVMPGEPPHMSQDSLRDNQGNDMEAPQDEFAAPRAEQQEAALFPMGLLRWAGHRDGGVRKPFRKDSGRPTGARIQTPLLTRLTGWVSQLVAGSETLPTTILLVGGPGNGKTDAIEHLVEGIDEAAHASGRLVSLFSSQYDLPDGQMPPRKVTVNIAEAIPDAPPHLRRGLTLVQDATEGDSTESLSAEELLLSDLEARLSAGSSDIYLCCVNRGILAHAATKAHRSSGNTAAIALLNAITEAVTSGAQPPPCWPLGGFPNVAVWPMDVESLVDDRLAVAGKTVAHQIFLAALTEDRWVHPCASGTRCPFCQNRQLLSRPEALDALVHMLRNYELASGKRWTFRDLFSLVPYLLVGDSAELSVRGKIVDPCAWAAYQLQLINTPGGDPGQKGRAPFLLVARLYHHRLFPRWPRLNTGSHRKAKTIINAHALTPGLSTASEMFRYLAWAGQSDAATGGEVPARIRTSFSDALDPALCSGNPVIMSNGGTQYTVNDVEELISLSVAEGFELVKNHLEPLERDLLKHLSVADDSLIEDNFPRTRAHHAELLRSSLRQFSARLIKRSLAVRTGLCRDHAEFEAYRGVLEDPRGLSEVRRQLRRLLHDDRNRFRAPLTTTFGQPVAHRARDVVLLAPAVTVRDIPEQPSDSRPRRTMPYLKVDACLVPLTFSLFRALREVVAGLHDASLPADIFALLNGVRLVVSGNVVHRAKDLDDDTFIHIGGTRDLVEISAAGFAIVKETQA